MSKLLTLDFAEGVFGCSLTACLEISVLTHTLSSQRRRTAVVGQPHLAHACDALLCILQSLNKTGAKQLDQAAKSMKAAIPGLFSAIRFVAYIRQQVMENSVGRKSALFMYHTSTQLGQKTL